MRKTSLIAGACVVALALSGCSSNDSSNNTLGVIKSGYLTMCADSPYAPFEFEDPSAPTGYSGFDVEMMTAIAGKLNLKLEVKDTDFDALQSGAALAAGTCDVGASAITITEERKLSLDFSDSYYDSLQSLLVPTSSSVKSLADLAGKKIGVQNGTTGLIYAEQHKPATATLVSFPSDGEMWLAIQAGQVDALLQDLPINNEHVQNDSSYAIVAKYETDEKYGFALSKDKNPELLAAINTQLAALRADGTYKTLYDKYFS